MDPPVSSRNPEASIVGFRSCTPAISVRRSTIGRTEMMDVLKALGGHTPTEPLGKEFRGGGRVRVDGLLSLHPGLQVQRRRGHNSVIGSTLEGKGGEAST